MVSNSTTQPTYQVQLDIEDWLKIADLETQISKVKEAYYLAEMNDSIGGHREIARLKKELNKLNKELKELKKLNEQ